MPAKSQAQQRLMGMVRARQQGRLKSVSPKVEELAKRMDPEDVEEFASTERKGLPKRKSAAGAWVEALSQKRAARDSSVLGNPFRPAGLVASAMGPESETHPRRVLRKIQELLRQRRPRVPAPTKSASVSAVDPEVLDSLESSIRQKAGELFRGIAEALATPPALDARRKSAATVLQQATPEEWLDGIGGGAPGGAAKAASAPGVAEPRSRRLFRALGKCALSRFWNG